MSLVWVPRKRNLEMTTYFEVSLSGKTKCLDIRKRNGECLDPESGYPENTMKESGYSRKRNGEMFWS